MQRIRIIPYAKLLAVQFALIGVVAGLIYAFGGLIYDLIMSSSLNWGTALAFLSMIGMPLLFSPGRVDNWAGWGVVIQSF